VSDKVIRILVVDDDLTALMLMRAALEKSGFVVGVAENGEDALRQFRTQPFDLIMLDVEMPGLNGYQVCAQLRNEVGVELPIIMVTGMDDLESVDQAFAAGATDFLSKPINWGLIGHRVKYLLRAYMVLQDLHTAIARNTAILNAVPDTLLRLDVGGLVLDVRSGGQATECQHLPRPGYLLAESYSADVAARIQEAMADARVSGLPVSLDFKMDRDGEQERYYEARLASINGNETLCLLRDISERKLQELQIIATQNKLQATLEAIPDLLFEVDLDGRYLEYHSPRSNLPAAPHQRFVGRTFMEVLPPEAAQVCMMALQEAFEKGISTGMQFAIPVPQGTQWFELSVSHKRIHGSQKPRFIVLSRDISERKEAEKRVHRLAFFDTLTGLPNRLSFSERLEREVQRARYHNTKVAVLCLGLDGFKNVNETFGHGVGDRLLREVADRLRQGVRPSDQVARNDGMANEVDLARVGGDEFSMLIPQLQQVDSALIVAQRIHVLMQGQFVQEGRDVVLTTSIGIAVYPDDGKDAGTLLKHADTAMNHAKAQGRNNCQFYSAAMTQGAMRRLHLESNLRLALERGEFSLVYQPQFDLASGRIHSLEALIRWQHPVQGFISPMDFIPAAEKNGLIVPIGDWVLRTACAEIARWQAAGLALRVAVNLSAVQFRNPELVNRIKAILAATAVAPEWLELEVTEGALMEDSATTLETLNDLRQAGMQLSLDDFGTGYSSLSYLKRLPLNNLKIDQSFVRGLPADKESLAIVRTIVSLAKNLGFTVTAEGVETLEQARILHGLSCETLQGYYFSKPVRAAEIAALLERRWTFEVPSLTASQPMNL